MRIFLFLVLCTINFAELPFNLNQVTWLHTNIKDWPVTSTLREVKVDSTWIELDYDKAGQWPDYRDTTAGSDPVEGNPWIFVQKNGSWYGATWEWLRPGQTKKFRYAVNGDHIKRSPLDTWSPQAGEVYYFMVAGLSRFNERNTEERTNIVGIRWPAPGGSASSKDLGDDYTGTGSGGGGSSTGNSGSGGSVDDLLNDTSLSDKEFVRKAYRLILNRAPRKKELTKFSGRLSLGLMTRKQLIKKLQRMASGGSGSAGSGGGGNPGGTTASGGPGGGGTTAGGGSGGGGTAGPFDPQNVRYLHGDISSWPETAQLGVSVEGSVIRLDYSKKNEWPQVSFYGDGSYVVANAWVAFRKDGQWYAATWAHMRPNDPVRYVNQLNGGSFKVGGFEGWTPKSGKNYWFCVSGLARNPSMTNVQERSNWVKVKWP